MNDSQRAELLAKERTLPRIHPVRREQNLTLLFLCIFLFIAPFTSRATEEKTVLWTNLSLTDLDSTIRIPSIWPGETHCFDIYLPTGYLKLDATVPLDAEVEPKLSFQLLTASSTREVHFVELAKTATSLLISIRQPGEYAFCVAAQNPAKTLELTKFKNSFVASQDPAHAGDPDIDEPPPDPFSGKSKMRQLVCRQGKVDDHGDTPYCATVTRIGQEVSAEILNERGDDSDYFAFHVSEQMTVQIESKGTTDTLGALYDHRGYRLALDDDGTADQNFRMIKTLEPGFYFLGIEGDAGAEGPYRVSFKALPENR